MISSLCVTNDELDCLNNNNNNNVEIRWIRSWIEQWALDGRNYFTSCDTQVTVMCVVLLSPLAITVSCVSEDGVEDKSESCWSRFKAGCLVMHIFFLSTIETTTRMLNSITREHRRIRRTIDVEKRKVKQKALYIFNRGSIDARLVAFISSVSPSPRFFFYQTMTPILVAL